MPRKPTKKKKTTKKKTETAKPLFWLSGNYRQVNQVWQKITSFLGGDPNVQVMHCGYNPDGLKESLLRFATAADIIIALKNRDIFDDRPRIIKMQGLPEDYSVITDYLSYVNNNVVLVVCGRPGYRAHGSTRWIPAQSSKFYKAFKSNGKIFDFPLEANSNQAAITWVKDVVTEEGAKIDGDAARRLVELKGRHLDTLTGECRRLSLYRPKGKIVLQDVEDSCMWTFQETVWEFIDALDDQKVDDSLRYLQKFYATAGQATGESFYGEVSKLLGAVTQHFLFLLLLKDAGGHLSYSAAQKAIEGMKKMKPSDAFKLSKGILNSDELPDWFSSGYVYANIKKRGIRSALGWKQGKIYDALRDVMRCTFLCRKQASQAYQELCLNTFVLSVCGKISSADAAIARGDDRCFCV